MALLSFFQERNSDESEADMRWWRRTLEREREKDNPSQAKKKNNRLTQMLYLLFPGHSVSYSSEVIIQQSALVVM